MKTIFIPILIALTFLFSALFLWRAKAQKRTFNWTIAVHSLIIIFLSGGFGTLLGTLKQDTGMSVWTTRLAMLLLGFVSVIGIYMQSWSQRHRTDYEKDSFEVESLFSLSMGFLSLLTFIKAYMMKLGEGNFDALALSDGILLFLVPFLVVKSLDFAGQKPFPVVENQWIFPIENINIDHWQWRNLMQISFEMKDSIMKEYIWGAKSVRPWIEAPMEQSVGDVFRLMIQEQRKRGDLSTIQDLGTEYKGDVAFWLLFRIKKIWWKPSTWSRDIRYLNPSVSLVKNEVKADDIIVVERVPRNLTKMMPKVNPTAPWQDIDATVVIR